MERYLVEHLLPLARPFAGAMDGVEWWCNTNNDLDWHIDKDEAEGQRGGDPTAAALDGVLSPRELRRWRITGGRQRSSSNGPPRTIATVQLGDLDSPGLQPAGAVLPGVLVDQPPPGALLRRREPLGQRTPHHAGVSATGLNFSMERCQPRRLRACKAC